MLEKSKLTRMSKRRVITVFGLAAIVVAGIATVILRPGEPVYQGKPLSHWLEELGVSWPGPGGEKATEAIQAIGTNALPYLLRSLKASDSEGWVRLVELSRRQNLIKFPFRLADEKRDNAKRAFMVLGPTAESAIPDLAVMLKDLETTEIAATAFFAVGPKSIPVLTEACSDTSQFVRGQAAFVLAKLKSGRSGYRIYKTPAGGTLRFALPVLDEDINALGENLSSPVAAVRRASAEQLSQFAYMAEPPVPALEKAMNDPDMAVREAAAEALKIIGTAKLAVKPRAIKRGDPAVAREGVK
jgi:hypothetical protein